MINSTELRRITEDNDATKVNKILANLELRMLVSAQCGESSITLGLMPVAGVTFGKSAEVWDRPVPDLIVARVLEVLREHGYKDTWTSSGDEYVPRGLQNDYDGSGPLHVNWVVRISW